MQLHLLTVTPIDAACMEGRLSFMGTCCWAEKDNDLHIETYVTGTLQECAAALTYSHIHWLSCRGTDEAGEDLRQVSAPGARWQARCAEAPTGRKWCVHTATGLWQSRLLIHGDCTTAARAAERAPGRTVPHTPLLQLGRGWVVARATVAATAIMATLQCGLLLLLHGSEFA